MFGYKSKKAKKAQKEEERIAEWDAKRAAYSQECITLIGADVLAPYLVELLAAGQQLSKLEDEADDESIRKYGRPDEIEVTAPEIPGLQYGKLGDAFLNFREIVYVESREAYYVKVRIKSGNVPISVLEKNDFRHPDWQFDAFEGIKGIYENDDDGMCVILYAIPTKLAPWQVRPMPRPKKLGYHGSNHHHQLFR